MKKWLDKYDAPKAQNGIEGTMGGLTDKGFNYNGAWGGPSMQMGGNIQPPMAGADQTVPMYQMGGYVYPTTFVPQAEMGNSLPGSVGFTYARTQGIPSEGPYGKKTVPSAQNGQEMQFYQNGLDWTPRNISEYGSEIPMAQPGITQPMRGDIQTRGNQNLLTEIAAQRTKEKKAQEARTKTTIGADKRTAKQKEKDRKAYESKVKYEKEVLGKDFETPQYLQEKDRARAEHLLHLADVGTMGAGLVTGALDVGSKALPKINQFVKSQNIYKNLPEDAIVYSSGLGSGNPYLHNKKQIFLSDFESDINEQLFKGLDIKKVPGNLRVKIKPGNTNYAEYDPKFTVDIYHDNKNIGYVGLDKLNTSDYTIPDVKGTIYSKVAEEPYMWDESLKGSGISGEVNKAITNSLQNSGLGNLYSSLVHTPEGRKRWENLIKKGYATKVASNRFKLLEKGGVVKDDDGYWNPENWGKVVEIDSPDITMKGVNQDLIGVSDEGDVQYMTPGKDYKFKGKKVKEYPVGKYGVNQQDEKTVQHLDQLLNFTNKPKAKNGWLDKYK